MLEKRINQIHLYMATITDAFMKEKFTTVSNYRVVIVGNPA